MGFTVLLRVGKWCLHWNHESRLGGSGSTVTHIFRDCLILLKAVLSIFLDHCDEVANTHQSG